MRLGNIEILRGLAALWVVGLHTEGFILSRGGDLPFGEIFQIGGAGVDLFFVISGFVITLSVLQSKTGFRDFFVARLIRIVPAYWAITLLTCTLAFIAISLGLQSDAFEDLSFGWVVSSFLFLSQPLFSLQPVVYQGWTLEYEMLFYLAVAIAIAFIKRRNVAIAISGMLVVIAIIGFEWVDWVALEFVFGVIVAFMFRSFALKVIPAVGLICLSIVSMFSLQLYELERFVIFGIPFALLVWGAASVRQTRHPIAIAAGRDSYAVYLVQVVTIPILGQVLNVAGFLNSSPVISFILILVLTQLAGTLFETQFDGKVRAWLQSKWRNHRAN